jgi:hypothetical protein
MLSRMAERRPIRKQNEVRTVWWEPDAVCLIDQTSAHPAVVHCESVEAVAAIRVMQDRPTAGTP